MQNSLVDDLLTTIYIIGEMSVLQQNLVLMMDAHRLACTTRATEKEGFLIAHSEVKPLTDQSDRRTDMFLVSAHDGTSLSIRDHNEKRP